MGVFSLQSKSEEQKVKMSGCSSCLRFLLVVSNLVLALLGLLLIGGGVWLTLDQNQVEDLVGKFSNYTSSDLEIPEEAQETFEEIFGHQYFNYLLIGIGAVTFLVSLFGFFGAKKESVCLMATYIIFTILLIIIQVSAITIINIQDSKMQEYKSEAANLLNIELENIEISHRFQTIFFGVSTGVSLLFLLGTLCLCRSARKPDGYQHTLPM